jgi:hypothetical protein
MARKIGGESFEAENEIMTGVINRRGPSLESGEFSPDITVVIDCHQLAAVESVRAGLVVVSCGGRKCAGLFGEELSDPDARHDDTPSSRSGPDHRAESRMRLVCPALSLTEVGEETAQK